MKRLEVAFWSVAATCCIGCLLFLVFVQDPLRTQPFGHATIIVNGKSHRCVIKSVNLYGVVWVGEDGRMHTTIGPCELVDDAKEAR